MPRRFHHRSEAAHHDDADRNANSLCVTLIGSLLVMAILPFLTTPYDLSHRQVLHSIAAFSRSPAASRGGRPILEPPAVIEPVVSSSDGLVSPPAVIKPPAIKPSAAAPAPPGQPSDGDARIKGQFAIAITLMKVDPKKGGSRNFVWDGASTLATSIETVYKHSKYNPDLIVFVHPSVPKEDRDHLKRVGWSVIERKVPVKLEEIESEAFKEEVVTNGCCGMNELLKFYAYTLTEYQWVLHIDTDTVFFSHIDDLLAKNVSLVYTRDVPMTNNWETALVQGGFILVKPSMEIFYQLLEIFKRGNFGGGGWENSGIGYAYGGATVQGLLAYYYYKVAPAHLSFEANMNFYNNMGDTDEHRKVTNGLVFAHFTVCQKPWYCISPSSPVCKKATDQWWKFSEMTERKFRLKKRKRCPGSYEAMKWS